MNNEIRALYLINDECVALNSDCHEICMIDSIYWLIIDNTNKQANLFTMMICPVELPALINLTPSRMHTQADMTFTSKVLRKSSVFPSEINSTLKLDLRWLWWWWWWQWNAYPWRRWPLSLLYCWPTHPIDRNGHESIEMFPTLGLHWWHHICEHKFSRHRFRSIQFHQPMPEQKSRVRWGGKPKPISSF